MSRKHKRVSNAELHRIAEAVLARDHAAHAQEKRHQWKLSLAKSLWLTLGAIVGAHLFHLELMFKGVELLAAAITHFVLFGLAD